MGIDVSTLQLVVDSRQVKAAKEDLAALAVQGKATEDSLGGLGKSVAAGLTPLQAQINQMVGGYAELTTASDAYKNADVFAARQAADQRTSAYRGMFDSISAQEKVAAAESLAIQKQAALDQKLLTRQQVAEQAAYQKEVAAGLKELAQQETAEKLAIQKQAAIEQAAIQDRQLADDAKVLELRIAMYRNMFDEIDARAAQSAAAQSAAAEESALAARAGIEAKARLAMGGGVVPANHGYPETAGYTYTAEEEAAQTQARVDSLAAVEAYRARSAAATAAADVEETAAKKVAAASSGVTAAVVGSGNAIRNQSRIVSDASSGLTEALTGQYGRVRRSIAGIVNASGLLNSVFTAQGVAVALSVAAIGLLAKTAYDAIEAESQLEQSIIRTNYAAGQTADQIKQSSAAFSTLHTTSGQVLDIEQKLAASGIVTSANFNLTTQAAIAFKEATGASGDEITRVFADIAQNPLKTLEKLNQLYGNITPATLDHVKALQDESDKVGAANLAYQALFDSMSKMASAQQAEATWLDNEITKWHQGANAIGEYYHALVNGPSVTDKFKSDLANYTNDLAEFQRSKGSAMQSLMFTSSGDPLTAESLEKERAALIKEQNALKAAQQAAADAGVTTDNNKAEADANAYYDNHFAKMDRNQLKLKELVDLTATYQNMWDHNQHGDNPRLADVTATVGPDGKTQFSGGQYDKDVAAIDRKFKSPGAVTTQSQQLLDTSKYTSQLQELKSAEGATLADLKNQRASYELSTDEYYSKEVAAITQWKDSTIAALRGQEDAIKQNMGTGKVYQESQAKLIQIEGQIGKVEQDAAKQVSAASTEKVIAHNKEVESLGRLQAALDRQAQAQERQIQAQINSVGMGQKEAQRATELANIQSQGADKEYEYGLSYKGDRNSSEYKAAIAEIQANTDKMIAQATRGYAQLDKVQANWKNGAISAFVDWADAGKNEAALMASFTTTSFDTMSSSILQFATTGKTSMKDMVRSILTDFAKMELRIAESKILSMVLGAFLGGASGAGAGGGAGGSGFAGSGGFSGGGDYIGSGSTSLGAYNALGGVYAGAPDLSRYSGQVVSGPTAFSSPSGSRMAFAQGGNVMGEAGEEGIFPLTRGADGKLGVKAVGSGGGANITIQTNVTIANGQAKADSKVAGSGDTALGKQLANELNGMIEAKLLKATQPGGLIWKQRNGQLA